MEKLFVSMTRALIFNWKLGQLMSILQAVQIWTLKRSKNLIQSKSSNVFLKFEGGSFCA